MSITDELREWASQHKGWNLFDMQLNAIADRIDVEHESACAEAYGSGVQSVALPDMTAYIKLPVDDDGVPIRIGDTMEWLDGSTAEVIGIGNGVFFYKDDESDGADWSSAESKRHHHEPTVEDVLREFLGECEHASTLGYTDIPQDIFNTYAAKLRLAGEAE